VPPTYYEANSQVITVAKFSKAVLRQNRKRHGNLEKKTENKTADTIVIDSMTNNAFLGTDEDVL
jgi:hypothetical protein